MNVYQCEPKAGGDDLEGYCWHVFAPTWKRAKQLFFEYANSFFTGMEWTDPISIRIKAKGVDYPEGVDEQYQWARDTGYPMLFPEDNEEFADLYASA